MKNEGWEGRVLALLVSWDSFQLEEERLTTMYGGVTTMASHLFFCASTIRSRNQPSDLRALISGGQDPFCLLWFQGTGCTAVCQPCGYRWERGRYYHAKS